MLSACSCYDKKKRFVSAIVALAALCPATRLAGQAATLPPTAPTGTVSAASVNPQTAPGAQQQTQISWDGTTLQVITTNSSLNSLLHEIASKTKLQISGSVPEERIFGTYGPGSLEDVLSDLLDGVAVNMLFIDRTGTQSKQLILTSRSGGPSLPSQSVQTNTQNSDPDTAGMSSELSDARQKTAFQPVNSNGVPSAAGSEAEVQPPTSGNRTPQEIFEQLQRLRAKAQGH